MKSTSFRVFVWSLLLLISAAAAGGCTRPQAPAVSPGRLSQEELLDSLRRRAEFWQSYQAAIRLKAESAKGKFPLKAIVTARLPRQFRLEVFNLFGQTTGVLVVNEESAALWAPSDKAMFTARSADALVRHLIGASLPIDVLAYSLIGSLPPRSLSSPDVKSDSSQWQVIWQDREKGSLYTWELTSPPDAIRSLIVQEAGSAYSIAYDPPSGLGLQYSPARIRAASQAWALDITVEQILPQKSLDESAFLLQTPDGVRVISLDGAP